MATEFIEIPDFDFSAFYYPDFVRSLTIYARQNVPEITDESDEEPFTQLIRAFSLVGHLNNVLLDVVATETLLGTARLLESVRSHLRLIDVILDQAKPASVEVIFELAAIFTTAVNFVPTGTQVATEETEDSPQITFEADSDNTIQPTNAPTAVFVFDPGFVKFLSNTFHAGDLITVNGVDFEPVVDFTVGASIEDTCENFVTAINISASVAIEGLIFAYRVADTAFLVFLDDTQTTVTVGVVDNDLETTLVDQTTGATDADLTTGSERRADDFIPSVDRLVKNVTFSLKKAGLPTGNIQCVIETDDSGKPSGTVVATSTNTVDIGTITVGLLSYQFDFDSNANLTAGEKYWFVVETTPPLPEEYDVQFVDGFNPAVIEIADIQFASTQVAVAEVADVTIVNSGAFYDTATGKYWNLTAQDGSLYYVWYNVTDGIVQANPAPLGRTGIQVDILLADTVNNVTTKTITAVDTVIDFGAVIDGTDVVRITQVDSGDVVDPVDVDAGVTVAIFTPGVNHDFDVVGTAPYWLLDAQDGSIYYVWYSVVDGANTQLNPSVGGRISQTVNILKADTELEIATKTATAIDSIGNFGAVLQGGDTTRITQANAGDVNDPVNVSASVTVAIVTPGSDLFNDYDVNGTALYWLLDATDGSLYYVWYDVIDGDFTQNSPALLSRTGIQIPILKADVPIDIATKTSISIDGFTDFIASSGGTDTLNIAQSLPGDVPDAIDVNANVAITVSDQGFNFGIVSLDSSGAGSSQYFSSSSWAAEATSLVMKIIADSTNFEYRSGGFGLNKSGESTIIGATYPISLVDVEPGMLFYIMHQSIMWDEIAITLGVIGSGINGVWEYYDGNTQDTIPTSITNLGPNLEFDVTSLMGELNRTGALVEVIFTGNGVSEVRPVIFENNVNIIRTTELLGQVSVSVDANEYIIGTEWNDLSNITDETQNLTQDGSVTFDLPQNLTNNWIVKTINTFQGFPLRYRVISVEAVVQKPEIDIVDITAGSQYLLFTATQGQTRVEDPLGSSDGSVNQEFELSFFPLIVESLVVNVDEGTGFSEWNKKDNFLTSTQISKDYTLEVTADDVATITFGDGQNGKKPAFGVDNIKANYRVFGNSQANDGNVGSSTITINKSGIAFVNRVFNPRSASGFAVKEGSTQADLARLKIAGPATLRVRNRGITPEDFEFLATEYVSNAGSSLVSRALAIEETFGVKTLELVTVGTGGALLTQAQLDELSIYFNGSKPNNIEGTGLTNHQVTSVNYTPNVIDVTAQVTGGNQAQIENALKALLNPEALFEDGITYRWAFADIVPTAIIISEIIDTDRSNIKNVTLTSPAADVQLTNKELPLAGTLTITIV